MTNVLGDRYKAVKLQRVRRGVDGPGRPELAIDRGDGDAWMQ
jgi:hypothetical protein